MDQKTINYIELVVFNCKTSVCTEVLLLLQDRQLLTPCSLEVWHRDKDTNFPLTLKPNHSPG